MPGLRNAEVGLRDGRDRVLVRGAAVISYLPSTGPNASYVAGHPEGAISRHSSFMAFGALTHINTIGKVDELRRDDYYVFSAGSSGKHSERNIGEKGLHVIYVWVPPASCWRRHPTGGHASTPAPRRPCHLLGWRCAGRAADRPDLQGLPR